MFIGTFNCNVDNKGRLVLPVKFRELLEQDTFYITKGLDDQLVIYRYINGRNLLKKFIQIVDLDEDAEDILRFFLGNAFEGEFDKQGRININSLRLHAITDKKATIVGLNDRIEIWACENMKEF